MASHGVPRTSEPAPKTEQARIKELHKIREYRGLVQQVTQQVSHFNDGIHQITQTYRSKKARIP